MTENTENTENTAPEPSHDELVAELATLRAERAAVTKVAPELSTRDRSTIKPQDHQPANGHLIRFEFHGESFEIDARFARDVRTAALFRSNDFETAITRMIGEDGYENLLTLIEDEDGFADAETLGEWVNLFFEKAGAKN